MPGRAFPLPAPRWATVAGVHPKRQTPGQVRGSPYRFDWDESPSNFLVDLANLVGAGHGLEVSFVFGDFKAAIMANNSSLRSITVM
jgi:hypothetical protein